MDRNDPQSPLFPNPVSSHRQTLCPSQRGVLCRGYQHAQLCCLATVFGQDPALWGLSNFQWLGQRVLFHRLCLSYPVLVGLTDRYDAKNIYIFSTLIAAAGSFGFALTAQGFWSAAFCWGLVGAGLAGTYMPGLQILNARLDDDHRLRLLPYYTSAFGIGTGLSFFIMGWLYSYADWTSAFIYAGIGSLLTGVLVSAVIRPQPVTSENNAPHRHPLDFRPAFRNTAAMRYILSYGAHNFELFAFVDGYLLT